MALTGMLLGAIFGLGVLQICRRGRPIPRPRRRPSSTVLLGLAVGLGLFLLTGWLVLGIAGGFLASQMLRAGMETRHQRQVLARRGELARVASRLRDACLAGHGLPAAVGIVAAEAGPAIRTDMLALAQAVRDVGVGRAFAAYGERVPDPLFGVFARMVGEADRSGSGALGSLLTRLASQTSKEVAAASDTEARQERATAVAVASFAVGLLVLMRFGSPTYRAAYSDALGQAVMAAGFAPIGLGYAALVRSRRRAARMLSWGAAR